ncbi:MAG: ribosome biogenesis/translation initiation ATPase RLI [Candidatus Woesearchaeota archaeon]
MRLAFVNKENCKGGVDCNYICMSVCPINRAKKDCITIVENKKVNIDEKLCIGCGICVKRCPFNALSIINLPEELKIPIHRYGKNGFALYNLPTPESGKVVGILGRNAIGKTTALKIISGIIKPNFGKKEEFGYEELIKFFKGQEAQKFFEELKNNRIRVSYKPQNIDQLPSIYDGKVLDLLKRVDERNLFEEIVEKLDLKNILERNIKELSGGELQRVAIAATVLKRANLYIFDEPTSYLDINQRLRVAKFIKEMVSQETEKNITSVLVVEHDLLVLDYMSDLVYVFYGKSGCYGVVSMPKSTRQGINEYLEGFLREENMRIREKQIVFEEKPPVVFKREEKLNSWKNITKRLGSFSLEAKEGSLFKHQVVGVLGENGIGKTTFARIIAGEITPDSGNFEKVVVSYKPQYLAERMNALKEKRVLEIIPKKEDELTIQVIRNLEIPFLEMKKIGELSGGELQRIAIVDCLLKEADIYLLDEPSAYLDVEERMIVAKTIRDFAQKTGKTFLVIDHDLLFLDSISEALIVFSGEPSINGSLNGPLKMEEGMNLFLEKVGITLRRDVETKRPRINKEESKKDRMQKGSGKYYYA